MGKHLTDQELNSYIHRSLTDAQRETMDRHLAQCAECRTQMQAAQQMQREIHHELTVTLRRIRPSEHINFQPVGVGLNRRRRWSVIRFHSLQLLNAITIASLIMALFFIGYQALSNIPPEPMSAVEEPVAALFDDEWNNPEPFRAGLVQSEQELLNELILAPVYHINITISNDLQQVVGRQQVRYVNNTSTHLDELYFRLYPNLTDGAVTISNVEVDGHFATYAIENYINLYVGLPKRLAPGETAVVQLDFQLEVGRTRQTLHGALALIDDVLSLAYFYPVLANYHLDFGWQLTSPTQEVVSAPDNSFFEVKVVAPKELTIITSGIETKRQPKSSENPWQTVTYAAGPVNQFYLAASRHFTVTLQKTVGETKVNSYTYAESLRSGAYDALNHTVSQIEQFSTQHGAYPFAEIDIIGTPTLGLSRPGIAFPGILLLELDLYQANNFNWEMALFGK